MKDESHDSPSANSKDQRGQNSENSTGARVPRGLRISSRSTMAFLSAILGAFLAGVAVIKFLDERIALEIESAVKNKSLLKGEKGATGPQGPSGNPVPIGTISAWSLSEIPRGWLVCDGSMKPRSGEFGQLAKLFEIAGFPYGQGDGATTFTLPDYRGYFLRGVDHGAKVDPENGRVIGSIQSAATGLPTIPFVIAEAGEHSHSIGANEHGNPSSGNSAEIGGGGRSRNVNTNRAGNHTHSLSGGDAETRPRNVAVHWIIFAGGQ